MFYFYFSIIFRAVELVCVASLQRKVLFFFISLSIFISISYSISNYGVEIMQEILQGFIYRKCFFTSIFRLIHIINILPVDNFGTQIELCRTAFSAYMAITSYTLLYRLLALRHKLVSKNVYRYSGTFRQI